ncbi:LPS export ABC transporter periplasmic protein LptC [Tunicatimonas pelagia]|uniref:LPS export ABC transporter periplasmic protein LptC n=1 Tax=Tunicatimonas pelagia TaxID=931531 RepID=UPI002665F93B|nr:LPS export ABC transporter periplasmic protein LptC [Tunicatimonas pelagia]WKN42147.1 LPS export ABC transporter periplasmic protein LptC [Tunicatimonas pelagia]
MSKQYYILLFIIAGFIGACDDDSKTAEDFKEYEGPTMEATNTEILYSDSAQVRIKLQAQRQLQYGNGDMNFPEGIYIEFFDENGVKSTSIEANQGYYSQEENKYTATGEVVVKNLETGEKLETELLHWEKDKHSINTDRYVEIESDGELLMGEGLEAKEDFSSYEILKPTGVFSLE